MDLIEFGPWCYHGHLSPLVLSAQDSDSQVGDKTDLLPRDCVSLSKNPIVQPRLPSCLSFPRKSAPYFVFLPSLSIEIILSTWVNLLSQAGERGRASCGMEMNRCQILVSDYLWSLFGNSKLFTGVLLLVESEQKAVFLSPWEEMELGGAGTW